jgi:hypothetical protein
VSLNTPAGLEAARLIAEHAADKAADKAAEQAVKVAFLMLGVDITDAEQVKQLREDITFLQRTNRGAREIKSAAVKTCVGAVVTGLLALLVAGFKDHLLDLFHIPK